MSYGCDQSRPFPVASPPRPIIGWSRWWHSAPKRTIGTTGGIVIVVFLFTLGAANREQNPRNLSEYLSQQQALTALSHDTPIMVTAPTPEPQTHIPVGAVPPHTDNPPKHHPASDTNPAPTPTSTSVRTWAPQRQHAERRPSDHAPVDHHNTPVRVRVVTIRARVTAYTPYDHAETEPQWADGIVAWHPGGRQRRVANHRYGLATDWSQFPPGATFIRVPGYMETSFPRFPENFRVVDDACGQSRIARRRGLQPVIDVRFMTRFSAIDPRGGWGSRQLDVEVIYPENFSIPTSLRRWVVKEEWHTYHNGQLIERQRIH
ncbi:MAG: hypothetical protein EA401_14340 [Planctomycetota bacterium]|nr:MAG: hypothetical protein EA401_14340 [Planctomycetota bacterium]